MNQKNKIIILVSAVVVVLLILGASLYYFYSHHNNPKNGNQAGQQIYVSSNNSVIFVYLSDKKYSGNLEGRSGADAKCDIPAGLQCKENSVHALLTVSNSDSLYNFTANYGYSHTAPLSWYNRDTGAKTPLADNWTSFINEKITNGQKEGTGKGEQSDLPWSGGWGRSGEQVSSCEGWTSSKGDKTTAEGPYGAIGGNEADNMVVADGWAGISFATTCDNQRYIRCACEE